MLALEEIDLLTKTGPGTPCGAFMRRYWQPVALTEELTPEGAPARVRLLGEDFVLFRDERGRPGLLGLHCAHRGADLSYGRVENGGLRCLYHGWLFDVQGQCLEQPAEPKGSDFYRKVRQRSYPCQERGGLIFAYLGPGEPPLLPAYEPFGVPEEQRFVKKFHQECNYLQAIEGNLDPAHQSFLHRRFQGSDAGSDELPLGTGGTAASNFTMYREDLSPAIEVEETDFGLRLFAVRSSVASVGEGKNWVKVLNFVLPGLCFVPGGTGADGYTVHWNVPIDDASHWKYMLTFRRSGALDKKKMLEEYTAEVGPDYRLLRNEANRYRQSRGEMKTRWFSGLGSLFPVHDVWVTNSQSAVQDRTDEHLAYTDKAIVATRKLLLKTIRDLMDGGEPRHLVRDSRANDFPELIVLSEVLPATEDWRVYWKRKAAAQPAERETLKATMP